MENEKSIWNKTIFSETPDKYDDNFQIMNMKYKLKNIKKNKKENYKNIELLENIYDNSGENIEGFKANKIEEQVTTSKDANSNTNGYKKKNKSAPTVSYGNLKKTKKSKDVDPDFLGLPDKDYDGIDRPDKGNKDDPRVALIRIVNKIFGVINKFNYKIALAIAKTLSRSGKAEDDIGDLLRKGSNTRKTEQNTPYTNNDVLLIQKYIGFFESILVAFFATYNWFYIMFYYYTESDCKNMDCNVKDEHGETNKQTTNDKKNDENNEILNSLKGTRIKVPKLSSYFIQNEINNRGDFLSIFYSFINIFFIFALAYVEYLQSIMMNVIPKITKKLFNYKGCFIAIFVMLIMFFYYFNSALQNFLVNVLSGNTKDFTIGCMYFFLLLIYFFGNYNIGYLPKTAGYTAQTFLGFVLNPFFGFIMAFMRFIVIMLISVPFGGVACILYMLFNSFFGILFNTGILKYFGTFFRINDFIKDNNDPDVNKPKTDEDAFIYKIKSSYNNVINFIYKYAIFISYVILLTIAIFDYFKNIKNYKLKLHLIILSAIFIFIMLISMFGIFFNKTEEIINPTEEVPEKPEKSESFFDIVDTVSDAVIKIAKKFGIEPDQLGQMAKEAMHANIPMNSNMASLQKLSGKFNNTNNASEMNNILTSNITNSIEPGKIPDNSNIGNKINNITGSISNIAGDLSKGISNLVPKNLTERFNNTAGDLSKGISNVVPTNLTERFNNAAGDLSKGISNVIPKNVTETLTKIAKNTPTGAAASTAYNVAQTAANSGKNILSKASGMFSNIVPKQKPKIITFSGEEEE